MTAPARLAGNVVLVHESLNAAVEPRKAWQYNPGTRRVRRAPDISYDNPGTNTDGLSTSDAFDGYNGAPDRYDWMLVGKSEKFVAYNNYKMANAPYADLVLNGSVNQDLMRYELHRVWTVQATLRSPGFGRTTAARSSAGSKSSTSMNSCMAARTRSSSLRSSAEIAPACSASTSCASASSALMLPDLSALANLRSTGSAALTSGSNAFMRPTGLFALGVK